MQCMFLSNFEVTLKRETSCCCSGAESAANLQDGIHRKRCCSGCTKNNERIQCASSSLTGQPGSEQWKTSLEAKHKHVCPGREEPLLVMPFATSSILLLVTSSNDRVTSHAPATSSFCNYIHCNNHEFAQTDSKSMTLRIYHLMFLRYR